MISRKEKIIAFASLIIAAIATSLFLGGAPRAFPLDDAYIHLCYARNLATGNGFSFNPGEPSFGTSSPLWVIVLAPFIRHMDAQILVRAASFIFFWIGLFFAALITSESLARGFAVSGKTCFDRYFFPVISSALLASSGNYLWITYSGMETALLVMLSLASIYLLIREKPAWAGYVLLGLCALCRIEAVLLIAIVFFWQWFCIDDKKKIFAGLAIAAAIGLSFYVYAYFKLGAFFPTTRSGKLASDLFNAGISFQGGLNFLERHLSYLWLTQPGVLISLGLALVGLAVWALSPRPTRIGPVGILVIFALAVFLYHDQFFRSAATITPFNNFRYQVLFFPALALGLTRILGELFSFLGARWARVVIAVLMLGLLGSYSFKPWRELYLGQCRHIDDVHIRTAEWASANLPPSARIACFDIGSLGFFSGRHVIDLGGLIDPSVDPYLRDKRVGPYLKVQRATHYIELGTPGSERLTGVRQGEGKLYDLAPLAYFPGQRMREPVMLNSWEMKVFEIKWK